jgi:hypothetical protein
MKEELFVWLVEEYSREIIDSRNFVFYLLKAKKKIY